MNYLESRLRICHAVQVRGRQLCSTGIDPPKHCTNLFADTLLGFRVSCNLQKEPDQGARRRLLTSKEESAMHRDSKNCQGRHRGPASFCPHESWSTTSSSVSLFSGFSDSFVRSSMLIMSVPSRFSAFLLMIPLENSREQSRYVRNRRYSRVGRYRTYRRRNSGTYRQVDLKIRLSGVG